jgi:hypothetical protein
VGYTAGDTTVLSGGLDDLDVWIRQRGLEPVGAPWAVVHAGPSTEAGTSSLLEFRQPYRD